MPDSYVLGCDDWCSQEKIWSGEKCVLPSSDLIYSLYQNKRLNIVIGGRQYVVTLLSISSTSAKLRFEDQIGYAQETTLRLN